MIVLVLVIGPETTKLLRGGLGACIYNTYTCEFMQEVETSVYVEGELILCAYFRDCRYYFLHWCLSTIFAFTYMV